MAIVKYDGYAKVNTDPAPVTLQDSSGTAIGTPANPLDTSDYAADNLSELSLEQLQDVVRQLIKIRS